jgi:hypothetical protein
MKTFTKILVVLIILIILGVALAAYFGFVPCMSNILGTTKARDLGIKYTESNYIDYNQKAKVAIRKVSEKQGTKGKGIEYDGKTVVDQSFTQEELSARINYSTWKYIPVTGSQVKINQDGTVEFSANVVTNNLPGFIEAVGSLRFAKDEAQKTIDFLNKIAPNPAVYAKFSASVEKNNPTIHVESLQVGRLSVPISTVGGDDAIKGLVEHIFSLVPGLDVESLTFTGGKMNIKGTAPTVEIVPSD